MTIGRNEGSQQVPSQRAIVPELVPLEDVEREALKKCDALPSYPALEQIDSRQVAPPSDNKQQERSRRILPRRECTKEPRKEESKSSQQQKASKSKVISKKKEDKQSKGRPTRK